MPFGLIPAFPPIIQAQFRNAQNAQSYGAELNWKWDLHEKWHLQGWYSFLKLQVNGPGGIDYAGTSPINQGFLMSSWDLPRKVEFDLISRYVQNLAGAVVPGYANLDARLGWRPNANWEFSIIGQNLLAPNHLEFIGLTTVPSAVNRGVYAQVVWRH